MIMMNWERCKQVRMYYRPGTGRRLLHSHVADTSCSLTRWQHVSTWEWRHSRHLESVMSNRKSDSVNRCVFIEEHFCHILSLPYFVRFETSEP